GGPGELLDRAVRAWGGAHRGSPDGRVDGGHGGVVREPEIARERALRRGPGWARGAVRGGAGHGVACGRVGVELVLGRYRARGAPPGGWGLGAERGAARRQRPLGGGGVRAAWHRAVE